MARRKIVEIDQRKCNGCGLCVPACAEGAIQIIDGKARLVSDVYCDGLGACLGECPQGAITIIERDADAFDERAALEQARRIHGPDAQLQHPPASAPASVGCPGAKAMDLSLTVLPTTGGPSIQPGQGPSSDDAGPAAATPSGLRNWPIQLGLVPPAAPWLRHADLLLVADCVPFSLADFHQRFLGKRPMVIGCPKLDDGERHVRKLTEVIATAEIRRLTVVHIEVPCCTGLSRIAERAIRQSGCEIPLEDVVVSIHGQVLPPEGRGGEVP